MTAYWNSDRDEIRCTRDVRHVLRIRRYGERCAHRWGGGRASSMFVLVHYLGNLFHLPSRILLVEEEWVGSALLTCEWHEVHVFQPVGDSA